VWGVQVRGSDPNPPQTFPTHIRTPEGRGEENRCARLRCNQPR
jgi:hypothetical protein